MSERARICLIDDDAVVREALASGLREAGHEVQVAPGAAAGLDLVRRGGADIIVTDMAMPGTSGVELIAEAKANWPLLPIVAISGATVVDGCNVTVNARVLGADALLRKPFRARELIAVVDQILRERRRPANDRLPTS